MSSHFCPDTSFAITVIITCMADENEELAFSKSFLERTRQLRNSRGWSQGFVADALGIPLERYKKYEQRSLLPHYLIEKFCTLHGCDVHFLITGKQQRHESAAQLPRKPKRA